MSVLEMDKFQFWIRHALFACIVDKSIHSIYNRNLITVFSDISGASSFNFLQQHVSSPTLTSIEKVSEIDSVISKLRFFVEKEHILLLIENQ